MTAVSGNVAKIKTNYRGNTIEDNADYIKYEIYVPAAETGLFEAQLFDEGSWTWATKSKVTVL